MEREDDESKNLKNKNLAGRKAGKVGSNQVSTGNMNKNVLCTYPNKI